MSGCCVRVPELRLTTHCTRKREDLSEALPTGMREVDETRLVLGRRVQRAGVANLPQQLWRKILHQAFMYLPGSISFRITASSSDYHIGISEYVRYISRAWWATRIQASMRGLLQRWRDLKRDLKGIGSFQLKELGSYPSGCYHRTFNYNTQLRFVQTPAQFDNAECDGLAGSSRIRVKQPDREL